MVRRVGRYELLFRIASGGMADLYLARLCGEDGFERLLALKLIHEHLTRLPEFVKMFIDEARLASRITHPNVAMTLELGRLDNAHFIAMEYVDGESVGALLSRSKPPLPYCVRIVSSAAAGLHAAHELRGSDGTPLQVVHRDVSPQNILISYDGAVKVVDFGVARARGSLHTTENEFKGKFGYMSPEQFHDAASVDRRSDVFALGVVLYEMTTWRRLFKASTQAETVQRVLHVPIVPPGEIVENYPPELEALVMRALQRDPARRQQTALELHEELEHLLVRAGDPVPASAIAAMMHETFNDRITEKRLLIEQHRTSPPAAEMPTIGALTGSLVIIPSVITFLQRKRKIALLGGSLILIVAVLLLVLLGRNPRQTQASPASATSREPSQPAPRQEPRRVLISASAVPSSASISLDGKPMRNPFELQRPAAPGSAELVISAPGYQPQRFRVSLERGGSWTVGLIAWPAGQPPGRIKKPVRRTLSTRKGDQLKKREFLDNPYE